MSRGASKPTYGPTVVDRIAYRVCEHAYGKGENPLRSSCECTNRLRRACAAPEDVAKYCIRLAKAGAEQ